MGSFIFGGTHELYRLRKKGIVKTMKRTANTIRNIVWGFGQQAVILLFPFAIRTIILRILGSEYLGLSSLFTSILGVLNMAELGFSSAVVFCMYEPIANGDDEKVCALLSYYRKIYVAIGVIILCIGSCIVPFLSYLIKSDLPADVNLYVLYFIYLLNTSVSYFMFAYKGSILVATHRSDLASKISITVNVCQYILQIIVLCVYKDYYLYIILMPIATIVSNWLNSKLSKKYYPQYYCRGEISQDDKAIIKTQVKGLMISKVCGTLRNSLDSIILSAFLGLITVAMYSNYYYIMSAVHGVLTIIGASMRAGVGNSIAKETKEKNYYDFKKFTFIYCWIASWCFSMLMCLYQPFMLLWTGDESLLFPNSLLILFCVYFYSLCLSDMRNVYIDAIGLWWETRYRSIFECVANLILNIVLGYYWGAFGVVLATLITMITINLVYGTKILYDYYFKDEICEKYLLKLLCYFIVTCISTILPYYVCELIVGNSLLVLALKGILCTLITNTILFLFYFRQNDFKASKTYIQVLLKR